MGGGKVRPLEKLKTINISNSQKSVTFFSIALNLQVRRNQDANFTSKLFLFFILLSLGPKFLGTALNSKNRKLVKYVRPNRDYRKEIRVNVSKQKWKQKIGK